MNFLLYTVGISVFLRLTSQSPHIFKEKLTCDIFKQIGKITKHYVVPAKINVENEDFRVIVALCTKDPYVLGGQTFNSQIFIYDKASTLNYTDIKPYEVLEDQADIKITIPTKIECPNLLKYTITIKFAQVKKPRLNVDECEIEIEIPNPDPNFHHQCRRYVDGKWFIDLTPLRRKTFSVSNEKGEVFKVSLCDSAAGCNGQAGCKIGANETTVIGSLKSQKVQFHTKTNTVTVVSSIKEGHHKRTMLVTLRCNWNIPLMSNPKLINEGTNFKFEVQSSLGCVKLPNSCIIKEENLHITYDLRKLSKKDGFTVANASAPIRLNICGDLQISGTRNSKCNAENSQVCEIRGNEQLNRGSIPHFELSRETLTASFTDGHQCNINETFSTIVNLKCSSTEKGPIRVSEEGCVTNISWETPEACPKFRVDAKSCALHTPYGRTDLNGLKKNNGFKATLSRNEILVYNICDKLNFNCSTSDEVSACLNYGNRQKIIGWNEPNLSYTNGKLQLKYTGEKCEGKNQPYSLTIDMICSFVEVEMEPVLSKVDSCTFKATVSSPLACLKPWETKSCSLEEENFKYDLSPLIRKDRNYEVVDDKNSNVTYFFNLCAPVLSKENLLFDSNSMMSMRDSSVVLITKKFTSLGQVTNPIIKDGEVLVKLIGSMCEPGVVKTTKINLECSNVEEEPKILKNDGCSLEFIWRTRHACPIMKQGGTCSLTDGNSSTKVPGSPIDIKMEDLSTYHFSLCLEYYRRCTGNGACVTKKILSKRILVQNEIYYVQFTLDNSSGSILKTANFMVQCDPYTLFNFSKGQSRNPDHLEVQVKTRTSCKALRRAAGSIEQTEEPENQSETNHKSVNESGPTYHIYKADNIKEDNDKHSQAAISDQNIAKEKPHEIELNQASPAIRKSSKQTPEVMEEVKPSHTSGSDEITKKSDDKLSIPSRKCEISVGGSKLNINDLISKEFKSSGDTYILNFDGNSSKCGGLICKNGGNLLNFIEDCPEISYGEDYINLKYSDSGISHYVYAANSSMSAISKKVEVTLKCNQGETAANATETSSEIALFYFSPKICDFSKSSNNLTLVFVIIGVFVFLFFILFYVLYKKNFFKRWSYDAVSHEAPLINHSKML